MRKQSTSKQLFCLRIFQSVKNNLHPPLLTDHWNQIPKLLSSYSTTWFEWVTEENCASVLKGTTCIFLYFEKQIYQSHRRLIHFKVHTGVVGNKLPEELGIHLKQPRSIELAWTGKNWNRLSGAQIVQLLRMLRLYINLNGP